jgi:hypothetical protein
MTHSVNNGHSVVEAEHEEQRSTEGDAGQQNVPDPLGAFHLSVVGSCHVAADAGCQGVQHDQRCEEATSVVGVEDSHTRQDEDEDGQSKELHHNGCLSESAVVYV